MTQLTIFIGRRDVPDGPLKRMTGRYVSNLPTFKHAELMVTDCKRYQRIKRWRPPTLPFSLFEPDLAIPSQGLDPTVDWHVYVKATSYSGATEFSNAYRFPHDNAVHIPERNIKDIKQGVLDSLTTQIAAVNRQVSAMDRASGFLDRAAAIAARVPGVAERIANVSAEIVDRMAAATARRERLEAELAEREREQQRQFGKKKRR